MHMFEFMFFPRNDRCVMLLQRTSRIRYVTYVELSSANTL